MSFFKDVLKISLLGVVLSSCSQNSESLTTAEKGVATGAVVGAGLGAIVGSSAGEAGAGVVMGSIAGAASGGVIGSSMEGGSEDVVRKDKRIGLKSKQDAQYRRTRLKSSLSEEPEETSFLGKNIWSRAPRDSALDDKDMETASLVSSNRPSGSKGLASKYAYGQIQRTEKVRDISIDNSSDNQRAQLKSDLIQRPTIELTKPKEDQLPKAKVSKLPDLELPKAQISSSVPTAKKELPLAKKQAVSPELPKAKDAKDVLAKKTLIEPAKTNLTLEPASKKSEEKSEKVVKNLKEEVSPVLADSSNPGSQEEVKELGAEIKEETKSAAKMASTSSTSKCAKGQGEIKRATTSASDSDKVFYLRRAILLCPEESSLRVDLAKVYKKLGLKDDAKREFTSVIEIDPSNETAQEELSIIMLENSK